jgi:predicted aspartyl protease
MGTFCVGCKIANHADRSKAAVIPRMMVDAGREYSWVPARTLEGIGVQPEKRVRVLTANGTLLERQTGFAFLYADRFFTVGEVIFAQPGDLLLLGARTMEGMSVLVDLQAKKLVEAGPSPAAPIAGAETEDEARRIRETLGAAAGEAWRVWPRAS